MTSVSQPGSSTTPRWDSRNSGFISPSQLQQWKQHASRGPDHEISHSPPPMSSQAPQQANAQAPPPHAAGPSGGGHTRSISSFSLFKNILSPSHTGASSAAPDSPQSQRQPGPQNGSGNPPYSSSSFPALPSSAPAANGASSPISPSPPRPTLQRSATAAPGLPGGQALHPEIKSIVDLTIAHAHKIYYSGPLLRRIERQPDGQKPARDEGWRDVWAQLGGTTLSVWDMQAVDEASKQGRQVPPTYINVTDSFVNVLEAMTFPATPDSPAKRYTNVLTLNTAGSNLLLFSCPSREALVSWATALRLSAWEKSRLEEIYTAHLIRIILNDGRDTPSPLVNGRMEGWVRIRIAGQTDWKQMWMVVCAGEHTQDGASVSSADHPPGSASLPRKKRMSHLFGRERSPQRPMKPMLQFLHSPKPKDRKKPVLTMRDLTQVFAVYPERPEWISRSTLMKLEGQLGDEELAASMKLRECWLLVMPEFEGGNPQASEMLKWLIAMHDAFELYGRPRQYSWNPRDPRSMMFAYPIGPERELLFLDCATAEHLDVRDERTSFIRSRLQHVLLERTQGTMQPQMQSAPSAPVVVSQGPPILPPLRDVEAHDDSTQRRPSEQLSLQLPPLDFESSLTERSPPAVPDKRALTPITERSVGTRDNSRSLSAEHNMTAAASKQYSHPATVAESPQEMGTILDKPVTASPTDASFSATDFRSPRFEEPRNANTSPSPRLGPPSASPADTTMQSRPSMSPPTSSPRSVAQVAMSSGIRSSPGSRPTSRAMSTVSSSHHSNSVRVISPRPTSPATALSSVYSASSMPSSPISPPASSVVQSTIMPPPSSAPVPPPRAPVVLALAPSAPPAPSVRTAAPLPRPPERKKSEADDILGEAGALYYMHHLQETGQVAVPIHRRPPPPVSDDEDEDESQSNSDSSYTPPPPPPLVANPNRMRATTPPPFIAVRPLPTRRSTNPTSPLAESVKAEELAAATPAAASRSPPVVRKPSGARAPASKMPAFQRNSLAQRRSPLHDEQDDMSSSEEADAPPPQAVESSMTNFEDHADALAALTFLEQEEKPVPPPPSSPLPPSPVVPEVVETPASPSTRNVKSVYRSSFAPSRQAVERMAKTQAQQAAHQAAVNRPGKTNGKANSGNQGSGAWADSSEEEEEEEEEDEDDDDDADSDTAPPPRSASRSDQQSVAGSLTPNAPGRPMYGPQSGGASPSRSAVDVSAPQARRPPRELPQLPGQRPSGEQEEYFAPDPRRLTSAPFSEAGRASFMEGPRRLPSPSRQSQLRPMSEYPQQQLPAARQTIWSQVLDPGRAPGSSPPEPTRDTFVRLEPSQAMTKAFTPHGLLSAGLQDKQDRSAKRQEELARETGASLINVPNKPPPPQTGLLGAVTAHERERKREGGIGATLTEREREKRITEERQRKLDDFQRQQLDQMQQGGSMYGGMVPQMTGYNPMMNPMMMGMNPMMTGGWGFPGMIPGFTNPQMFAAQQAAAQAYQQAMMVYTAGQAEGGGPAPLNPMMTGGSMAMAGMDPRMSMMGMPMMNTGMGMNPGMMGMTNSGMSGMGMNPGMGMSMGMMGPGMNPGMGMGMDGMGMGMGIGMQSTGNFDAPFSSGFDAGMRPVGEAGGPSSHPFSAANSTSGHQGSPATGPRLAGPSEEPPRGPASAEPVS